MVISSDLGAEVVEQERAHRRRIAVPIPRPWCAAPSQEAVSPLRVTR